MTQAYMPWGEPVDRAEDFWPTPESATESLLTVPGFPGVKDHLIIDEPAAGDGAIVRVLARRGYFVRARDIRDTRKACMEAGAKEFHRQDWITNPAPLKYIVTNPPFSVAQEFTRACLSVQSFYLALLLRLNVLGSNPWAPLWLAHPPTGLHPLRRRPSFSGDGKTDACNYAWFVWDQVEKPCNIRPI